MFDIPFVVPKPEGFVIYNLKTGQYSKGGHSFSIWAKKPKIWMTINNIKLHLTYHVRNKYSYRDKPTYIVISDVYTDCVIIKVGTSDTYEKTPTEIMYDLAISRVKTNPNSIIISQKDYNDLKWNQ